LQSTKQYEVRVTEPAENMLLEHAEFLAQVSPNAADRMLSKFDLILARIADNPFQFPFADELDSSNLPPKFYRKCLFEERYKALFRLGENEAHIVASLTPAWGKRHLAASVCIVGVPSRAIPRGHGGIQFSDALDAPNNAPRWLSQSFCSVTFLAIEARLYPRLAETLP